VTGDARMRLTNLRFSLSGKLRNASIIRFVERWDSWERSSAVAVLRAQLSQLRQF
jgi:hypothetical protein